ncbi:relA-associated inhibitor-like isoform X2 [Nyctibius grandis]|uniref:relA-associated inhibitor-like isoform X2 n=1 Tax=Nyctibius grandis TaxID=48427 RepID=UPI0035BC1849
MEASGQGCGSAAAPTEPGTEPSSPVEPSEPGGTGGSDDGRLRPGAKRVTFPSDEDIVSGAVEPKEPWRHGPRCTAPPLATTRACAWPRCATATAGSLAVEKCDPYRGGYGDCYNYLSEVERGMGVLNSGVVYALWDYSAALGDELSFCEGEPVTILRRQPPEELDWWWGSLYGHEGYVPRNYFGLFPRVRPQRKKV